MWVQNQEDMNHEEQIESLIQTINSQHQTITTVIEKYNRLEEAFTELLGNSFLSPELKDVYLKAAYDTQKK